MSKKAQISFEYIVILSVAILLLIPALFFFITYTKGGSEQTLDQNIKSLGEEIISNALRVYSLGKNSWLTLTFNIPQEIDKIYLTSDGTTEELIITYYTHQGLTTAVFFPEINLTNSTGAYPKNKEEKIILLDNKPGTHDFLFKSQGDKVMIKLTK